MLGPIDYALWFASALLEAGVVVCSLRTRSFRRYFPLNFFMLGAFAINLGRFVVFERYGFSSSEYYKYYYYSDALGTILLYLAVMGLYQLAFEEMGANKYVKGAAALLLGGTAFVSYLMVREHTTQLTGRFVVELSQNLYFVGVVLTYLLWGMILKLGETRTRLIQLVLALGVFFSAQAAAYALRNIGSNANFGSDLAKLIPPLAGNFLPLAWSYTFLKVSDDARLVPARVAAPHR